MTFREKFKFYKQKIPAPGFEDVIDFSQVTGNSQDTISRAVMCEPSKEDLSSLGLREVSHWRIFELTHKPGLLFLCNPFTGAGQRLWIKRSLTKYTRKPNKLNLDVHGDLKEDEDWWTLSSSDPERGAGLKKKLRWATLGYHHNWDTKVYSLNNCSIFPADLARLSQVIIQTVLGIDDFLAEAAIVNFYHMDSTLSGHVDSSETNLEAPLISFSFGQSAIFLIGGTSLEDEPTPIFIHSGDVVIMSGSSRLCYHGVPRIFPASCTPWDDTQPETSNETSPGNTPKNSENDHNTWLDIMKYTETSRINLNVRQVSYASSELT